MTLKYFFFTVCIILFAACNDKPTSGQEIASTDSTAASRTYGEDAAFLKKYNRNVIELESADGRSKVLLSADYQGRVMTSTTNGDSGTSFGWINYALIESRQPKQQFNPVGGEERFWLGPEGGQFALYFKKGDSFSINNWHVPPLIDTAFFDIAGSQKSIAIFVKRASLSNYAGNTFDIKIERKISLIDRSELADQLLVNFSDSLQFVAYRSENEVQNTGKEKWTQNKGLLSIWLLGMFNPSPETFVIIPFKNIPGAPQYITDDYFGKIPGERLTIKDSILYFKCDGKFRSKIGLSPLISKPLAASFDFQKNVLTVISFPVYSDGLYVNSKWEQQQFPYKGDVVNAYNDGPLPDGSQLGMFYELESSSRALELAPGESLFHRQVTCHFEGSYNQLRSLAIQLLGVDLNDINPALK
jgi:hypothetical protein